MAPSAGAVVVVANTHCTGFRIQNIRTVAFGVHPCRYDLFGRNAAPCGILTGSSIGHTVFTEHGVPLGTIGAHMRVHSCDLLGTMLCSCSELCIPHDQRLQAVVRALCIDQIQNSLDFTIFAENGIDDVSIGEDYMAGVSTPDAAVDQWMNIDFTRERILNADATTMSVGHYEGGVYNNYWVLIFSYPENSYTSDYKRW